MILSEDLDDISICAIGQPEDVRAGRQNDAGRLHGRAQCHDGFSVPLIPQGGGREAGGGEQERQRQQVRFPFMSHLPSPYDGVDAPGRPA